MQGDGAKRVSYAELVGVDESSGGGIPGVVRVVRKGDFIGVVAAREEQTIRAARVSRRPPGSRAGSPDRRRGQPGGMRPW